MLRSWVQFPGNRYIGKMFILNALRVALDSKHIYIDFIYLLLVFVYIISLTALRHNLFSCDVVDCGFALPLYYTVFRLH